ncbi:hypothetical protein [Lacinutrix sp. Hel_I_90]|uniref:hypothetical protein n=1 Tax=Lacinutrix sp. Hel_I_90 TaxID=1249999 RepID=UPI0005C8A296|nr:hypothetical protein [Lacinutrix sp. Hel_I_90]
MKTKNRKNTVMQWLLYALVMCAINVSYGQQINLDKVVRAGELTLFQELRNPKSWYYIIDKPSIAKDENGIPKFSFLRYVDNVRSGSDEAELREGDGGGIVHALIELGVTKDQIKDAQRELKTLVPEGVIKGPVIYNDGTIAIISSFAKADGELTKQVLGIGKAPILDGQRAAVSIQLTKQGAKILWESFKTPTPDMSISFEMNLSGYRSPKRALIEADFEQVYKHKSFEAGISAPVLAAEIKLAFDDLVKKGDIKVTQIGSDEDLQKIMESAYNKILAMMFDPVGGTGTPSLGSLTSGATGNTPSLLDRATTMLNTARTDARTENTRIRAANQTERERVARENESRATNSSTAAPSTETSAATTTDSTTTRPVTARAARTPMATPQHARETSPSDSAPAEPNLQQEETVPSFAVAVSFQMKEIKQRGIFKIDLNKYTTDNLTLRFDKNFGNINCDKCFKEVNLDDALFKQRELVAFVDGSNATDFGSYINFATLAMKKKHQSGAITNDEVRIDRNNFNKEGNNFKLLYGWQGDDDRSKWLDYEYKTTWSFFGGHKVEGEWTKNDQGAIAIAPPLLNKKIAIEIDPSSIEGSDIRVIDVKLFYTIGDKEQLKNVTFLVGKGELSKEEHIILPRNTEEYGYEIVWNLKGNKTVSSGKLATTSSVLFVDDLPEN